MASRTQVLLEDDIDGSEATETIRFAFEGKSLAIDLSDKNAEKFRKAMAPYVEAARREGSVAKPSGRAKSAGRGDVSQIRAWAREHGYEVSERGRISREIQAAYDAA